jgi:hypothetical protein
VIKEAFSKDIMSEPRAMGLENNSHTMESGKTSRQGEHKCVNLEARKNSPKSRKGDPYIKSLFFNSSQWS